MLVTCPECAARYEVEDALIPPEGRRVQCSACDHVWTEGAALALSPASAAEQGPARAAADGEEAAPAPRPLAEEVKTILREEAEREARIRRERGLVELAPDVAPLTGAARPHPAPPPAAHGAADPLPDPDAINATLRAASAAERGGAGRGGFVTGLVLGLCLVGLAALAYVGAPRLAETVPATAPALEGYVASVDAARAALDRAVARASAAMSDLTGG